MNHENELAYLTNITQGIHLTYSKMMQIKQKLGGHPSLMRRDDTQCAFLAKNLFEREDKVKFEINHG